MFYNKFVWQIIKFIQNGLREHLHTNGYCFSQRASRTTEGWRAEIPSLRCKPHPSCGNSAQITANSHMHWLDHNAQVLFPQIILALRGALHEYRLLVFGMQNWGGAAPSQRCRDNFRIRKEDEGGIWATNVRTIERFKSWQFKGTRRSHTDSRHQLVRLYRFEAINCWSGKVCLEGAWFLSMDNELISIAITYSRWRCARPSNQIDERIEHFERTFSDDPKSQVVSSRGPVFGSTASSHASLLPLCTHSISSKHYQFGIQKTKPPTSTAQIH